jgi:2-dehydro-3-deoxyphosphogluconate aldolase/(4S)-4-hydroxy-2-oxoglutarate aldolase
VVLSATVLSYIFLWLVMGGYGYMDKIDVVKKIQDIGVVAVIRGKDAAEAIAMSDACIRGGVTAIELAFTTPRAHEVIAELSKKYAGNSDVLIGAGTVLDAVTARIAILSGAQFVVSPAFDLETVKLCNRYRIAVMPGTTTLNGVLAALESGADVIKIFPGEILGMKAIRAIHGPIPQAPLMPTGGVNAENAGEWIKAGCIAVGAGGALTGGGKTAEEITAAAKKFIASVAAAR